MKDTISFKRIQIIDSHTGGEPTRVVIDGGPDLGCGTMAERRELFQSRFDEFRALVVNEPRGSDVIVGALLCPPVDPRSVAGVIFFNNVGALWMCGHGTIGLAVTLGHLGRIGCGRHCLETPAGPVTFDYDGAHEVGFDNVPSYRFAKDVRVSVEGLGAVTGDIAWGGNWFFLVDASQFPDISTDIGENRATGRFDRADVEQLTDMTWRIRQALMRNGICGADGSEIDHIELFGAPVDPRNHSRNFVLCPGRAYDRSPCGTGTSAKLACLYADGKLKPGDIWRQESILGSLFTGSVTLDGQKIIPRITGTAYVTAESTLLLDRRDDFQFLTK